MIYVLDTDVMTLCELPDSPEYLRLHSRVLELARDDRVVTSIITCEEQTRGWLASAAKSRDTQHQIRASDLRSTCLLIWILKSSISMPPPPGSWLYADGALL